MRWLNSEQWANPMVWAPERVTSSWTHNLVVGPTDHRHEVTRGHGENIGARNGVGALELQRGFEAHDEVKRVAGERAVELGVALGGGVGVGGDEERGVAAADDAVVEEEAEDAGGGGGGRHLFVDDDSLHGGGELGAGRGTTTTKAPTCVALPRMKLSKRSSREGDPKRSAEHAYAFVKAMGS
nr:hypothetical protein Iba_chr08cCG14130 [Ipomoea batatas]